MADSGRERWTVLVPVESLLLTDAVSREFKVERVTFVHRDRLPYVSKRHGLGVPVSDLEKRQRGPSGTELLRRSSCLCCGETSRHAGRGRTSVLEDGEGGTTPAFSIESRL